MYACKFLNTILEKHRESGPMTTPIDAPGIPSPPAQAPTLAPTDSPAVLPKDGGKRPPRLGRLALVLFLAISIPITWFGHNQHSARNLEGFPGDGYASESSLLGLCNLQGEDPFFFEDWPVVEQAAFFSGWDDARVSQEFWLRPYPGFFAALLAPVFGIIGAALLVNWLAWAACAWATWRLSTAQTSPGSK